MNAISKFLQDEDSMTTFIKDEDGVTAIEYGLIAALIAVVIIAAVRAVGVNLTAVFTQVATELAGAI